MRVKCINIYNQFTKEYETQSHWLSIGKEYIVLSIVVHHNRTEYQIVGDNDNKAPGWHEAKQFEIVSNKIPKNWKIFSNKIALFTIEPESWNESGFWEDCFDHDPKALEIYRRELEIIYNEENEL